MNTRRNFLQKALLAGLVPVKTEFFQPAFPGKYDDKSIIVNPDEGETYFVRENTPITFKITKKTNGIDSVSICMEDILPGSGIPVHKHLNADEYFIFHSGTGLFILDDKELEIKPGSTGFVQRGTWHGLKNTGKEKIILSFGFSPAGFENFFKEIGTIKGKPFKARGKDEFKAISEKYGMVFK